MTTDTLQLDSNYNALVQELKLSHSQEGTIYKNAYRYKHNDIVYIPEFTSIKEIIKTLPALPNNIRRMQGTERFKILSDYILTFNLLQQYFSPHENNKNLIALDNRYIEKSLTSRYRNGKNKFFKEYFKLELKGIKGLYTSGYSLTKKAKKEIGVYSIVIHKDKLNEVITSFLEGTFDEYKKIGTLIPKDKVIQSINNSYIEIPQRNIDAIKTFDNIYSRKILANYIDGKLYYNKDKKDYGRTYSYLHTIPKEMRNELFAGFTEIDIESAAQSILYRLVYKRIEKLEYLKYYVENKKEVREKLSKDLGYSMSEVKRLLQVITFSTNLPSKEQLHKKPSFKGLEKAIDNEFIKGLSKDLNKVDELLKNEINSSEKEILIRRNGSVKSIDVRCYKFQSIESKLMEKVQDLLSNNSFHLHDAVYVKSISEQEKTEITKYLQKFEIFISYTILDSKMFLREIEEVKNNMKIFMLRTTNLDYKAKIQKLIDLTEHIIPGTKQLSLRIEILKHNVKHINEMPKCNNPECNNPIYTFDKTKKRFCSRKCQSIYNNKNMTKESRYKAARSRDYDAIQIKRSNTMKNDIIDGKNAHARSSEKAAKSINYIISVRKGFDNCIPIHIIASVENLQILDSRENRKKGSN